ncbi:MAG TPA: toll/interleukin-1 receptor domain-containing protein, partial [Tepidisphaeraceae bacterium]|nr:toll/interleukin-1 receptor domain-containing protein [Tepidisphaeraceae bacterium]
MHDVFISYSTHDKPIADAVCAGLEQKGIRCWIAPRDILAGVEWGQAIVEAISSAKVMVLLLSDHANQSSQIPKEVDRAVNKGVAIIPLRIQDVQPKGALEYYLGP